MALKRVPTRYEIGMAQVNVIAREKLGRDVPNYIREIAEWPEDQAAPEPGSGRNAS